MGGRGNYLLLGVLILCGVASPWVGGISPYYFDILIGIGINIILAVSLNLVNGYTGQFSLGHAGFMAVGAYLGSALSLVVKFPYVAMPDWTGNILWWIPKLLWVIVAMVVNAGVSVHNGLAVGVEQLPHAGQFLIILIYGGLGAAFAGLLVGIPSLRLRGDYLAIVTLGFNEIIKGMIQNCQPLGAQLGLNGIPAWTNFFWTFGFALVTIFVVLNLVHSTYGRGFLAVRDDEIAAEAMGIHTTKYKVLAFVAAAFFAGIAGGLFAHFKQHIDPEAFGYLRSVDIVVMVILGGMGNTIGVVFAAILLTILPELLRTVARYEWLPHWLQQVAENRMILYSLLLIVLMLTRPQGLFGNFLGKGNLRKS